MAKVRAVINKLEELEELLKRTCTDRASSGSSVELCEVIFSSLVYSCDERRLRMGVARAQAPPTGDTGNDDRAPSETL